MVVLLFARGGSAQGVIDAGRVEFTPSPDHDAVVNGVAVVTSYQLQIFVAGTVPLARTVNLGKPARASDGFIRVDFLSLLSTPLLPGLLYEARVAAVGPGGTSPSVLSNPFSFTPTCAPTLSASSASVPASASTGSVGVNASALCAWSASSPVNWVTITSGYGGVGSGTVAFSIAATASTSARSATLKIGTRDFTITQAGTSSCTYSISPTGRSSPAAGETTSVAVTTGSTCQWSATTNATWLNVSGGGTRAGSGTVNIVVGANAGAARVGTVSVAGITFTVNQSGACVFTVSPRGISAVASGRTGSISVTTGNGCTWQATGMPAWLTIPTGTRSGSGTLSYSIAANNSASPRTANVTVAALAVAVSQAGATAPNAPKGIRIVGGRGSQ